MIAPHPLARLRFEGCRVPPIALLGEPGDGFKVAMRTLDVFRASVGAAALGFARRALDESARARALARACSAQPLADFQLTQAKLADMALDDRQRRAAHLPRRVDAATTRARRVTREAAMAKLHATEAAQRVIDAAVQLYGGLGVTSGQPVERLYREIRALRIYEGATEVQQLIIARQALAAHATEEAAAVTAARGHVRPRQPAAARAVAGPAVRTARTAYPAQLNCAVALLDDAIAARGTAIGPRSSPRPSR